MGARGSRILRSAMSAAFAHRRLLACASLATYALVFVALLLVEVPGLGLGHFFYIAIALMALTGGLRTGVLAGAAAAALYALGVLLNPDVPPTELLTASGAIRLMTYSASGALIGWFARSNGDLLERLHILAERDFLTGLPNTRAFEAAITRRLESGKPFALLLGDMDGLKSLNDELGHVAGNDALIRLAELLGRTLRAEDEVARVGGDEFAVLTSHTTGEEAASLAGRLEAVLESQGTSITFGWSVSPQEGTNALSLYRAADERLYARKLVRSRNGAEVVPLRRAPIGAPRPVAR